MKTFKLTMTMAALSTSALMLFASSTISAGPLEHQAAVAGRTVVYPGAGYYYHPGYRYTYGVPGYRQCFWQFGQYTCVNRGAYYRNTYYRPYYHPFYRPVYWGHPGWHRGWHHYYRY